MIGTRPKIPSIMVVLSLLLIAAGCTAAEVPGEWSALEARAREQGSATLYVFKYEEYFRAGASRFEEETGIKVDVVAGSGEGTYQKVAAESKGRGTVDLWLLSGPQVQAAVDEGLLYGPIAEIVPNGANVHPFDAQYAEGFDHGGHVVPAWRNQAVFAYDTRFVSAPPDLGDLERWTQDNPGRFTYCDPGRGGSGQAFVNSVLYWLTGEEPARYFGEFDRALVDQEWPKLWAWLRELGPRAVYAAGNDDALEKLARGEVWIAATWEEMFLQWRADGRLPDSVAAYLPAPGLPGGADFLGIPLNSPRKAAALLFINYLLSEESQAALMSMVRMRPVRTDVAIPESLRELMIPSEEFEDRRLPWPHAGYKREYKARWSEEVAFQ